MTPQERAHANLAHFVRLQSKLEPGGRLVDADGIVAFVSDTDYPTGRVGIRTDSTLPAREWARRAVEFFDQSGKLACVHARVDGDDDLVAALADYGFKDYSQEPEMVCDHRLPDREPAAGTQVRFAADADDVQAYAAIAGEAFAHLSIPAAMTQRTLARPDVLLADDIVIALGDADGVPSAGALVALFGDAGYVGWVACRDAARGRALGDTVTRAVTNAAFDRGATLVTLEASRFGEHTYARMGYQELYRYRLLIRM